MEVERSDDLMCRTCLASSSDLLSIFSTRVDGLVTICNMLTSFCNMKLSIADGYSGQICGECSLETLRAYNFKLKCEKSDQLLRGSAKVREREAHTEVSRSLENLSDGKLKSEFSTSEIKFEIALEDDCFIADGFIKEEPTSQSDGEMVYFGREKDKKSAKKTKKKKLKKIKKEALKNCGVGNDLDKDFTNNGYKKIYECPKCGAFFQNFKMISKHLRKLHDVSVPTERQLQTFLRGHRKPDLKMEPETKVNKEAISEPDKDASSYFRCADCEFKSKDFKDMKSHIISHKGEKYIHCDQCDYKCSMVAKLMKHQVVHGEPAHQCTHCPYRASTVGILRTHAATQHSEERPFHCDRCTFTCKLKINLAHHIMRTHDKVRTHACHLCSKAFFGSYQLKMHVLTHTGDRPQVCEHCGMRFTQKSNLQKHTSLVHSTGPFPEFCCSLCPYKGKTALALRTHVSLHSGEKPHACDMCPFVSSSRGALRLHRRRHMGDTRHACSVCSYRCYTANRLRAHERIHTGERPFPCDACSYRGTTSMRLKNHKKSHENSKSYACQFCAYRANYRSNLVKHLQKGCGGEQGKFSLGKDARTIPVEKISLQKIDGPKEAQDFSNLQEKVFSTVENKS